MRCAAITKGGARCKLEATHGSYCWSHAPETADERSQRARRGGKAGGNGRPGSSSELSESKHEIRNVIVDVLSGKTTRGVAAVVFQGYNALLKAVETERRIKETQEIEERLAALERVAESERGGRRWGL